MHDQLETKSQELDSMLSTIKISLSSEARNASIISKKRDAVRQLADMKPLMEHLLHQQHQLLHQLADVKTEHSAEISTIVEMNSSLEGTLARMNQFL